VAVVDDDHGFCASLSRLLQLYGLQPVSYPSAESFLEDLNPPRFSCLVLDVKLGGISGILLNRQLISAGSMTPVVFLTAHDEPEARREALRTSCVAFLRKTDRPEALLGAIRTAIERDLAS